jgi:hypothetical protein
MQLNPSKQLPVEIIGSLKTTLISDFPGYVDVQIATSNTNANYLILPFKEYKPGYVLLVEISEERLKVIKTGEIGMIKPFENPEKGFFYIAKMDENMLVSELYIYKPDERDFEWPLPKNITNKLVFKEKQVEFDIREYAHKRGKIAIEFRVYFNDEKESTIKMSAIKRYLTPYYEIVKTALLSNTLLYNEKNIEGLLHMGFSKIEFNCLFSVLECDDIRSPQELINNFEKLETLYHLFGCDDKEQINKYLESFNNKRMTALYISIIRKVLDDKSTVKSTFSTSDKISSSYSIEKKRYPVLKKTILEKVDPLKYDKEVTGALSRLDINIEKNMALFTLNELRNENPYTGRAVGEAYKKLTSNAIVFIEKEYECELKVTYTPPTDLKDEKYSYELQDFKESGSPKQLSIKEIDEVERNKEESSGV